MSAQQPVTEKIAALRATLEAYAAGDIPQQLFDPVAEQAKSKVRNRALRLLDERARSRHELRQRLLDAEFPSDVVDVVLDDMAAAKLIDDAHFAYEWVRQRHERRGKSARVLDQELISKGVAAVHRQAALEQISMEMEQATARELAMKKAKTVKSIPSSYAEKQKLLRRIIGVLVRRGFPSGMAMENANEALESRLQELEDS
ncbi:MAG: regulatory protein RecX [Corynebacterium sp.]|nr:regulatory protein RecX [Corynebacterium sp.]